MTNPTPTAPETSITHLASLAAAVESGDRDAIRQTLAEMADELLELAAKAPTQELWRFLGSLHEAVHHETRQLSDEVA